MVAQLLKDDTGVADELEKWLRELLLERKGLETRCMRADRVIMVYYKQAVDSGRKPLVVSHSDVPEDDSVYIERALQAFKDRLTG